MSASIGAGSGYYQTANILNSTSNASNIESTLNSKTASDEELMKACKNFESYMLEQVFKGMEKTIVKSDEKEQNDYMAQFGDMLYEEYAKDATNNQGLGLAQMLYESMKRNS